MKILRLTTTDNQCIFDTTIGDELLIKPDAKIALQSLTLEQDDAYIVIDNNNDKFTWSSQNGQEVTIDLPHQVISGQNFNDFLETFTRVLNNSVFYDFAQPYNSLLAMEWRVSLTQEQKVSIQHHKSAVTEHATDWQLGQDVSKAGGAWGVQVNQPPADLDGFKYNMLGPVRISSGTGFLRAQVHKATYNAAGNARQGVVLGLSRRDLSEVESDNFTEDMMDYGLALITTAAGGDYKLQTKGVFSAALGTLDYYGEGDARNDFMEIIYNGTYIQVRVYDENGERFSYTHPEVIESDVPLYPFIVFHEDLDHMLINKVRSTWSYFANELYALEEEIDELTLGAPPMPSTGKTNNYINFNTIALAEFLGFPTIRRPEVGYQVVRNATFTAPRLFQPRFFVNSMIVELLNMKLDSWDGYPTQEQRKSILAFVPQGNQERMTVYEPNTQNFVDLRNKEPLLLRNIRARIVQGDYTRVNLLGQASLVLLIDG